MYKVVILIFAFHVFGCGVKSDKNVTNELILTDQIEKRQDREVINRDSLLSIILRKTSKSHDPDTSLAYFLYANHNKYSIEFEIQYQRYDLEETKLVDLIKSLYNYDDSLSLKIKELNLNKTRYIKHARRRVLEYYNIGGVSSRTFRFLAQRQDSLILPLVEQIIVNDAIHINEKLFAVNEVIKFYGDSTLYKKLNYQD